MDFFFFLILILINLFRIWSGERARKLIIWGFLGSLVTQFCSRSIVLSKWLTSEYFWMCLSMHIYFFISFISIQKKYLYHSIESMVRSQIKKKVLFSTCLKNSIDQWKLSLNYKKPKTILEIVLLSTLDLLSKIHLYFLISQMICFNGLLMYIFIWSSKMKQALLLLLLFPEPSMDLLTAWNTTFCYSFHRKNKSS